MFYFLNDAEAAPQRSRWAFLGHSRLFTFIWSRVKALLAKQSASMSYETYYKSLYEEGQPGWAATQKAFLDIRDICRERSIRLQVVLLPELHDLKSYPFDREHGKVKVFLDGLNISYLDIRLRFPPVDDPHSLWVALDDAHPNEAAHKLIAEHSLNFILEDNHESLELR